MTSLFPYSLSLSFFFFFFLDVDHFFKVLIEFVTYCFWFYVLVFWPSSPTRDWTCMPCNGRQNLNHWTTRKVPPHILFIRIKGLGPLPPQKEAITRALTSGGKCHWGTSRDCLLQGKMQNPWASMMVPTLQANPAPTCRQQPGWGGHTAQ